ncbi:zinc finger protein 280C isoform X2 [Trichomycterus rosablanca]|uniref:zinc finger protein 280C isoform X2 n=1 Tax=Trichomycterus rosablanca TaxID=2290929 RepID=UPI002F3586B9
MSELVMECEEEELEPWQKAIPEISLLDDDDDDNDDDDEPIFVGEICSSKPAPTSRPSVVYHHSPPNATLQGVRSLALPQKTGLPQMNSTKQSAASHVTARGSSHSVYHTVSSQTGPQTGPRSLNTVSPQPIMINNQGYIVSSPQNISNNNSVFSTSQYQPGTSFSVLPGQQMVQQVNAQAKPVPGVIHRPQVQLIQNNVVTLSNVQGPADISPQSHSTSILHKPSIGSLGSPKLITPTLQAVNNRTVFTDNSIIKRSLLPDANNSPSKRTKIDSENETPYSRKCPKCHIHFNLMDPLKTHMRSCCPHFLDTVFPSTSKPDRAAPQARMYDAERGKLIMLVSDFYYGKCEGDPSAIRELKSNTTFKCNSCLKILKNNIRFMNHMKHHLELEKQNSESWESHTTCQHCYRQYSTPFQLQCHIESAHSPYESTTNCKICELAFETEQVLLEHMKDNHKPGEMPYGCQVCNYRSSFFSDVENHFRTAHENTKDLLCPFCLKVLRSAHMYMQHYMKHQKKGIQRCGKCRLNFLTYKEKVEHKTLHHRTYKKPRSLDGLPPGTKVTIRASFNGGSTMCPNAPGKSYVNLVPTSPEKIKPTAKSSSYMGKARTNQTNKNRTSLHNNELKGMNNLFYRLSPGVHKCIECQNEVTVAYVHYPLSLKCSLCKYRTSCQKSFRLHRVRFHSSSSKLRLSKGKMSLPGVRSLTLVCLNCDFLANVSDANRMCDHLISRPNHSCQVILETDKGSTVDSSIHEDSDKVELCCPEAEDGCSVSLVETKDLLEESSTKSDLNETEPVSVNEPSEKATSPSTEELTAEPSAKADTPAEPLQPEDETEAETTEPATEDVSVGGEKDSEDASIVRCGSVRDGGGVSADDFLNKSDKAETVSVHSPLEPLTPSKVLEGDEAEKAPELRNHKTDIEETAGVKKCLETSTLE